MAVKADGVGGDEVEGSAEVGHRLERFDAVGDPPASKESDHRVENLILFGVQTHGGMSEVFADFQKMSGTAADVENVDGRAAVDF